MTNTPGREAIAADFAKRFPAVLAQYSQFKIVDWFLALLPAANGVASDVVERAKEIICKGTYGFVDGRYGEFEADIVEPDAEKLVQQLAAAGLLKGAECSVLAPGHTDLMVSPEANADTIAVDRQTVARIIRDKVDIGNISDDRERPTLECVDEAADAILALLPSAVTADAERE